MTDSPSPRFDHLCVALHVANVNDAALHYAEAFPCTVSSRTQLHVELVARDVPLTVDLFEEPDTAGYLHHLRLDLSDSAALPKIHERLIAAGLAVESDCDHLWVTDPDETPWMLSRNPGEIVPILSTPNEQGETP